MTSLYLGDAFGWQCKNTAKVALSQLGEKDIITKRCRKAQLIQAESHDPLNLGVKILGYIPVLNILAGGIAIFHGIATPSGSSERPQNNKFWILRGVSMILAGPLLITVDLIKTIHDEIVAAKYIKANSELIAQQFNTPHRHKNPNWPGEHVSCGN